MSTPDPLQDHVAWVGFSEGWERKKRLVMPPRLHVLDISEDRVLVRAKGALDETLIEVLPDRALNTGDWTTAIRPSGSNLCSPEHCERSGDTKSLGVRTHAAPTP